VDAVHLYRMKAGEIDANANLHCNRRQLGAWLSMRPLPGGIPENLVVIACRDLAKGAQAAGRLKQIGCAIKVLPLDLASFASVHIRRRCDLFGTMSYRRRRFSCEMFIHRLNRAKGWLPW
jgi:hypothetical protein